MQFEAGEPTLRGFPKTRAILSEQAHTAMSQLVAQGKGIGLASTRNKAVFGSLAEVASKSNPAWIVN